MINLIKSSLNNTIKGKSCETIGQTYPCDDGTSAPAQGQQEHGQNQHPAHSNSGTQTLRAWAFFCVLISILSCGARGGFSMALRWLHFSAVLVLPSQSVESLVTSEIRSEVWLCLSLSFSIALYLLSPLSPPHPHLRRDFVISFCMTLGQMMEKRPHWTFHFFPMTPARVAHFFIGFVWL